MFTNYRNTRTNRIVRLAAMGCLIAASFAAAPSAAAPSRTQESARAWDTTTSP